MHLLGHGKKGLKHLNFLNCSIQIILIALFQEQVGVVASAGLGYSQVELRG